MVLCQCEREKERLTSIPELGFDSLAVDRYRACPKLYADGILRLEVYLVLREPKQKVTFADERVADDNDCIFFATRVDRA